MFDSLASNVNKPKKTKAPKKGKEIPRTTEFVRELVAFGTRITYAALADASAALGEHTVTGMSNGQRGAKVALNLPVELQPHVCNGSGKYRKGLEWDADVTLEELKALDYVRPEKIQPFVQAFLAATEAESDSLQTTEASQQVIDDLNAENDEEPFGTGIVEDGCEPLDLSDSNQE